MDSSTDVLTKVFISSTTYDLIDLRAELPKTIESWGYEPVWHESPDFPIKPGFHSHDICLEAVKDCNVYLLIIDKRYGGTYAGNKYPKEDISITWYESKIAFEKKTPVVCFVRDVIWNERPTYKDNLKKGINIVLHHADNPKVFDFIDYIVQQRGDNWIGQFSSSVDLKEKLEIRLKECKKRRAILPPGLHNQTPPERNFVGKADLLEKITKWYKDPKTRIGALIGWGGVGKSAAQRKWFDCLKEKSIIPDGIFWWGFYRNADLERFLDSLLIYLAAGKINLEEMKSTWVKVDKIKELLRQGEFLIILDGLEEMQKGEEKGEKFGVMRHKEISDILTACADSKQNGLIFITTRYPLTDIKSWEGNSFQKEEIEKLSNEDARMLFDKVGVKGSKEEINNVINEYGGHALSLTLLSKYLVVDYEGDISKAKEIPPFHSDKEAGGKAHRILLWYAKQLDENQIAFMKIFSLFRREVTEKDFEGLFRKKMESSINNSLIGMTSFSFNRLTENLQKRRLIVRSPENRYSTHPLIKNYFESIFEEDEKKLCHKAIYNYAGSYAPEKPTRLEEMEPLFEQIFHGCKAGLYGEVFYDVYQEKLMRGDERYLVSKLGAWETNMNLILNFFSSGDFSGIPRVTERGEQSWLINEAGLSLAIIGRPYEAEGLFIKKTKMQIKDRDWKGTSNGYTNLADLQLRTGEISKAVENSRSGLNMAKKGKSKQDQANSKTYLAYSLFLSGEKEEAGRLFQQADEMQREIDPDIDGLYSIWGVFYADFLSRTGKIEKAFQVNRRNLKICIKNNFIASISRCNRSLGALERQEGNHEKAGKHLDEALNIARKIGVTLP